MATKEQIRVLMTARDLWRRDAKRLKRRIRLYHRAALAAAIVALAWWWPWEWLPSPVRITDSRVAGAAALIVEETP